PLRRSLVVRLLATSVLVAVCAIVATAWLAVQSTTQAIQQEQGRSLSDDKSVYDSLLGYAATHPDWSGVHTLVDDRARKLGRRITLMTPERQVIVDSPAGPSLRSARPSATVDPLQVDLGLTGGTDRIDARAVGPYKLPAKERSDLRVAAGRQLSCMAANGLEGRIVDAPSGRPAVQLVGVDPKSVVAFCMPAQLSEATSTEQRSLTVLQRLTMGCMHETDARLIEIRPDFTVWPTTMTKDIAVNTAWAKRADGCVQKSRQAQLKAYVAPAALLFVTDPAQGTAGPVFNLSRENTIRIGAVTGAVLVVAVLITVLVGRRLVRPLRALTDAARQPVDHQARVPVTTQDEIGYLATALNELAARREQTEELRKSMVSDVAHELRTPLTNIRSWLEAAQDGLARLDPQLLSLLLEEAVLLQHIIDDLRDLAAADAGDLRIHRESVYPNDVLEQVAEAHRGAAETSGVRLSTETAGDPEVPVDPARLRQLVGNLVANAVRHTAAGGTVVIRSEVRAGDLCIEVADTGTGIAAADVPKVFDRFWRADGSRARSTGGSGLGLAIARKLAEAHDGAITVESTLGRGSVFTVRLPVVPAQARLP
ncbi:MAG TPA: HAMP domain-containing sensor histidine kinase, partial [Actinoplanes sp.]|nr:HAMP domain-containing sensor histidine kinase [Actinoplanes sp.]